MTHHDCLFTEATRTLALAAAVGVDTRSQRATQETAIVVRARGVLDDAAVTTWNPLEDAAATITHAAAWRLGGTGIVWTEDRTAFVRAS